MITLSLDSASIIDMQGIIQWCQINFGQPTINTWYVVDYTWNFINQSDALKFVERWC